MNDWSACDLCSNDLFAFKFNDFNSMSCKFEVVLVFFINESVIFSKFPVSAFSQSDHFATNMNLMMLDDKFEVNFWELEVPLSFYSFQEESDGSYSNTSNMS